MTSLDAQITPLEDGWEIRVPLRREVVTAEKRTVVVDEVRLRREHHTEPRRVQATTRRERLRVDIFGQAEAPEMTVRRRD